jgi:hypothetical protein
MPEVYADILGSLTEGLYKLVNIALREYLQNSYDAITAARVEGIPMPPDGFNVEVVVTKDCKNVTISDNGIGMSEEVLREYTSIGGGTKTDPVYTGHKGIGKLAGLRFFEEFVVRTKQAGEVEGWELVWRCGEMMQQLLANPKLMKKVPYRSFIQEYYAIEPFAHSAREDHFTQVQLIGVLDEFASQIDERSIGEFVRANCPVPFRKEKFEHAESITASLADSLQSTPTFLNKKVVYRPYDDEQGLCAPVFQEIKYGNETRALAWFSWVKGDSELVPEERIRGLKFRCKGICVGDHYLFANNCMPEGRENTAGWFTGEVIVLDEKIRPNTARDGFQEGEDLAKFYGELKRKLGKSLSSLATARSEIHAAEQAAEKAEHAKSSGEAISPATLKKLTSRLKVLERYQDRDRYELDFRVIGRLREIISRTRAEAEKRAPDIERQVDAAIQEKDRRKIVESLLAAQTEKVETPSKKAKERLNGVISKAASILAIPPQTPKGESSSQEINQVVQIVTAYLESRQIAYDRSDIEQFVKAQIAL